MVATIWQTFPRPPLLCCPPRSTFRCNIKISHERRFAQSRNQAVRVLLLFGHKSNHHGIYSLVRTTRALRQCRGMVVQYNDGARIYHFQSIITYYYIHYIKLRWPGDVSQNVGGAAAWCLASLTTRPENDTLDGPGTSFVLRTDS